VPAIVKRAQRPDFFFVNIGANDGVSNDPIYPFLSTYRWRGIAVEPLGYLCDELRVNMAPFEGVAVEQAAIAAQPGTFYYVSPDETEAQFVRQVGSLHKEYIEKTIGLMRQHEFEGPVADGLEQRIQPVEVPCLTFDELLARHNVQRVDFLNIDAESADFEILMMIDFERWRPDILCVETATFTDAEQDEGMSILRARGYEFVERFDIFSQIFVQRRLAA
jgi:FkbM family methyltransferase